MKQLENTVQFQGVEVSLPRESVGLITERLCRDILTGWQAA